MLFHYSVIYNWLEADDEPIANLADRTFACCRFFEDFLITGGHDKLVSILLIYEYFLFQKRPIFRNISSNSFPKCKYYI